MPDDFAPFHNQIVTVGIEVSPKNLYVKNPTPPKGAESLTYKYVLNNVFSQ
jgi:hypothetical protein